jgi:hypothetical protein
MTPDDVLKEIKVAMVYKDIKNYRALAEKTGIQERTLLNKFHKPETFTITDIIKIAEILDMKMEIKYDK